MNGNFSSMLSRQEIFTISFPQRNRVIAQHDGDWFLFMITICV